jgi:hypothetical protein
MTEVMCAATFICFQAREIKKQCHQNSSLRVFHKGIVFHNIRRRASFYLSLSKSLALISSGSVGNECGVLSLDGNEILHV